MKPILFFGLFFLCLQVNGQLESPFESGASFLRLGNAGAGLSGQQSILYNQAGIANEESTSFSVHGAQLYNNSGVLQFHAAAVLPMKNIGVFGLAIQRYGIEGYNYQNYALTYARPLFANLQVAMTFNFYQFQIDGYGNTFEPNVEVGFLADLTEKISLGVHVANPFPVGISENTNFAAVFSAGISYELSSLVKINADIEKNIRQRENIKIGFDYLLHPSFALSAGINTYPGSLFFGFAIKLKNLDIDLGNGYHQILGNSTGLAITYSLGS